MNDDTIKVSQLPSADSITDNDLLMIVQNNENKKATSSQMVDLLSDEFANYYDKDETDALLDAKANTSDLSAVATSGDYSDLSNKPTIPTKTSDLTNDSGFIDKDVNNLTNYTLTSSLSNVAISGSYTDLSNTPTIPDMSETYGTSTTDGYSEAYLNNKLVNVGTSVDSNYRTNILYSHNLFNKDSGFVLYGVNNTGALVSNSKNALFNYLDIKPNTSYTLSTNNNVYRLTLVEYNGTTWIKNNVVANDKKITITTGNTTNKVRVLINYNENDTMTQTIIDSLDIMLNEGSTALPYEPYLTPSINIDGEEIYKQEKTTDITYQINMSSGFTLTSGVLYKKGNLIVGDLVVNGTFASDTAYNILTLPYAPIVDVNSFCGCSTSQYKTTYIGYMYIPRNKVVAFRSDNACSYAKLHICYITTD